MKKPGRDPLRSRITWLMLGCLTVSAAIVGRSAWIQLGLDPKLVSKAKRQFNTKVLIRPRRGMIVDREGEPLAVNVEVNSLAANPSKIQNPKTVAKLLSKALGIRYELLNKRLSASKKEFVWIKRHMSESDLAALRKWQVLDPADDMLPGLWMVRESKRVFPHGELAAHVLGDVNLDSEGLEGVELWANEALKGKVTAVSAVKDALGRPAFMDAVAARHLQDGRMVQLTIDASLQFAVEQELKASVAASSAKAGTVIVMNAINGEILAMANEPAFNPNQKGAPAWRRRNRALTDGYEPGSTFKPVLLASALSNGWKLTDKVYGEKGSIVVDGHRISEAEAHEKFEWISLKRMLQVSSNVVSAKLAMKLGSERYSKTIESLGFGSKTNSGFPGEISGLVPPSKKWRAINLANIGFGHGVLVTPLQMTRAYAAFANGGWLVEPMLIRSGDGAARQPKRVLAPHVVDQVVEALSATTEAEGTGTRARVDGYVVAGKTGTAQMIDPETRRYSRSKYISSFIGFPAGLNQKLVIFASIEEPKGLYYASDTAAPLFSKVLESVVNRFSLPTLAKTQPEPQDENKQLADRIRYSLAKAAAKTAREEAREPASLEFSDGQLKMPDLAGMTAREAMRVFRGHAINLEFKGTGVVAGQAPEPGKVIADGSTIRLNLSEP